MKKTLLYTTMAILACTAFIGCKQQAKVDPNERYATHRPYTRWWWFSSEIDTNDVRDQLVWMRDHEFGGVEIAWIYPMFLDSTTAHPEFLSPEWAAPVAAAKRIADSLGLGCDFTYGTLWPFNDLHLPDGDQTRTFFDSIKVADSWRTWDYPLHARILNHLDKEAFARYAAKMNKGLTAAYKGSPSGLFVDSWEVETEYLWTPGFEKTFLEEHGYDIHPYLQDSTLYRPENVEVYYDYMSTISGYVLREFYGPFADNAKQTGNFSRAQCGGAPADLLTAFSLVDIPETEAILYEPSFSKIAASAAALADKQAVTSETFTCAYGWTGLLYKNGRGHSPHQGKEQIADLKLICDALFANGTNQIIWHGMPYNKVGDTSNFFYTTCQISTSELNNLSGDNLREFNHYMTTVSDYMRRGTTHSQLAVYMPTEDAWHSGKYPEEIRKMMPWALGQYEMRYIRTPEEFKGMSPLWVNDHFLANSRYADGVLHCGSTDFAGLYADVQYMDYASLQSILRLAKQGLPVVLARDPQEPGMVKHDDYTSLVEQLRALPNVSGNSSVLTEKPLVEGDNIPDFWCRRDGDTYYLFFANPLSQTIRYPLSYCYAFTDRGSTHNITLNHHGRSDAFTLNFKPTESLLIKVTPKGVEQINLGYMPPKLEGYVDPNTKN